MKNNNKKSSSVVLFVYGFSILLMGSFFIFQVENGYSGKKNDQSVVISQNIKGQPNSENQTRDVQEGLEEGDEKGGMETSSLPTAENAADQIYSYEVVSKSNGLRLSLGDKGTLVLKVRNTGNTPWYQQGSSPIYLGTGRPNDRKTALYKEGARGWYSGNRILIDKEIVKPGQTASFVFEVNTPTKSGIYREFFVPVVEGIKWLEDKRVSWDVEVRDPAKKDENLSIIVNGKPYKYIAVSLQNQRLNVYENGEVKYSFVTSTGLSGMDTPKGEFKIQNKFVTAYSKPYDLYMDNWMAFTPDGEYGVHSLPYWILKDGGRLYEGENHLGTPVSHGCIRISLENSKILFNWAEIGTPLFVGD